MAGLVANLLISEIELKRVEVGQLRTRSKAAVDVMVAAEEKLTKAEDELTELVRGLKTVDPEVADLLKQSDWAEEP